MSEQDKERIEKEATDFGTKTGLDLAVSSMMVIAFKFGATSEHERMAELLKQERNNAIDEAILIVEDGPGLFTRYQHWHDMLELLKSLKLKSE